MAILKKKSQHETINLPDDVYYFLAEKIKRISASSKAP